MGNNLMIGNRVDLEEETYFHQETNLDYTQFVMLE